MTKHELLKGFAEMTASTMYQQTVDWCHAVIESGDDALLYPPHVQVEMLEPNEVMFLNYCRALMKMGKR